MSNPQKSPRLLILGVGMGSRNALSLDSMALLDNFQEIYFRTKKIPLFQTFSDQPGVKSLDSFFERSKDFRELKQEILEVFKVQWMEKRSTVYLVPGSPVLGDVISSALLEFARKNAVEVVIRGETDYLTQISGKLSGPLSPNLKLVDSIQLSKTYFPPYSISDDVIIHHIHTSACMQSTLKSIRSLYPEDHPVQWISSFNESGKSISTSLKQLDDVIKDNENGLIYLPGLGQDASFEAFQDIIAHLRAPDGCPWDRKQTHQSLRTSLLEETYEAIEAIDTQDTAGLREELGDLLLQIGLHAQIATDNKDFTIADVFSQINQKLVHRHPHVFAADRIETEDELLQNWEKLKAEERKVNGRKGKKGMLDGIPKHLAALAQAQAYQDRAARVGFDWDRIEDVWDKVSEELEEVKMAEEFHSLEEELGDLLFAVVNLIRWFKVDAETALRLANRKFVQRFRYIEEQAEIHHLDLAKMTLSEMDKFWDEAKKNGL